ncbi:amino acid adenylation domain-containing protein [Lujinxingia vulgaris]|uniref:Amino acid adenylation domain-containing protein n=1 Tax=Lujinxingia vulgaris TaxID=2600176 RepID=A0A5C6XJB7_9DELT|nr:amino acid adenylation domain-containing protein [Lujinxingia vulgaris]TXD39728.1 amino acid adenylation domain-containing protein [Lujinxingia vulgaris]
MPSIIESIIRTATAAPDHPALVLGESQWSYGELLAELSRIACAILSAAPSEGPGVVGIAGESSLSAHTGILASWAAGAAYTPLNPHHPLNRRLDITRRARLHTLVVGPDALDDLDAFLTLAPRPLTVVMPELDAQATLVAAHPRHHFMFKGDLPDVPLPDAPLPDAWRHTEAGELAYLLFTSGSTGEPKGVPITHANARAYLEHARQTWPLSPEDRVSRTFDLTFDLSIHDLLTTFSAGATLYPLTRRDRLSPGRFILHHRLTRFFCVPTLAAAMARHGQLREGALDTLSTVLFCGEALPLATARAFARAAPQAKLFNLYGPTEATIAICAHPLDGAALEATDGLAPLGRPFPDHEAVVVDPSGTPLPSGEPGELWLRGPQVFSGYWEDAERTTLAFAHNAADPSRAFYRTGDRAIAEPGGLLHFIARLDDQLKLRGHRVEPAEVEAALSRALGHSQLASLPWPPPPETPDHLVALFAHDGELTPSEEQALRRRLEDELPAYMVPERFVALPTLPINTNGKLDRRALALYLKTLER